ncbi:protein kinase domain containing protein [Babesia divergens]|uniref:Cyclin-dependent kinase 2 homolog n=1 Tax=Babesia divergens TaxID=32595 RepID=A0AAD9LEB8_BABDI|nr:protein kinase domain containing protein [Babesia divergens]
MAGHRDDFRYSDFKCNLSGACVRFPGIGEYVRIGEKLGCGAYGDVFRGYRVSDTSAVTPQNCDVSIESKRGSVDPDRRGSHTQSSVAMGSSSRSPEDGSSDMSSRADEYKTRVDTAYAESSSVDPRLGEFPDYAIKYFKDDSAQIMEEGFSSGTLRELSIMKSCNDHPNILKLVDVFVGAHPGIASMLNAQLGNILKDVGEEVLGRKDLQFYPFKSSQVFVLALYEFCKGGDLGRSICRVYSKGQSGYTLPEVKWYAFQLLNGLAYLHMSKIEHRDLKPNNIMLADNKRLSVLKIGDWGMGREFRNMDGTTTPTACTLFYRPIEVILGAVSLLKNQSEELFGAPSAHVGALVPVLKWHQRHNYGINVDNWSAACIIAELATGQPLFHGNSDFQVLTRIVTTLGRPTEEEWHNCSKSEHYPFNGSLYKITVPDKKERLRTVLRGRVDDLGLDLLLSLLQYNPHKRLSAIEALSHPWFHDVDFRKLDSLGVRNCLGNATAGMLGAEATKAIEEQSKGITSTTLLSHLLFTEGVVKDQVLDAIDRDHAQIDLHLRQPPLPIVVQYKDAEQPPH